MGRYIGAVALGVLLGLGFVVFQAAPTRAQNLSEQEKTKLRAEYDAIQQEIAQWQKVLDDTRAKKNTLQGDVTLLDAQIKKATAEIRSRNNTIARLADEINQKSRNISALEQRLEDGRESLAELLREKQEFETTSIAVMVLSAQGLSEFFSAVDAIDSINEKLQRHFDQLRGIRTETEKEKEALAARKDREFDARYEVEQKKKQIDENKKEKNELLSVAKSEEKAYQQVLAERQRRAEEIRSALFELRDTQGISFETALAYAIAAESVTGVRAAFILGILRQESNLGKNVGQCYLTNPDTGAGKGKNTGTVFKNVMHPTRDVPVFLNIMERLGRDAYSTVVSCPQSVGYGGAMGPSQFIPSTWKLYEVRIGSAVGAGTPDPWIPKHAIMATALYMQELGAGTQTPSAEQKAAAQYYAGSYWKSRGMGYAASVLSFATQYQNDIDFLNEN
ncbi:MAG: hypothetical protein UY83_C0010G0015 [Candidatus Adlerbacteria bacterium GW2011_GWA1_54_10]|nr:MAG: hypothetical protein UY83_C0010G0015 [Candidatus Adlerbacteria bacterium GW2011_GWA1_54_10]OGC87070.1 MAG: hypothetical protein A3B33_00390 [Candidatus Adlerbacteria bacterium RIFCSPLOWO2_01_FULL_54_16]